MHLNPHTNILKFSQTEIEQAEFKLSTKARSLGFGRRLFKGQINHQTVWLKVQGFHSSEHAHIGFQREFDFYRQFQNSKELSCMVVHQLIDSPFQIHDEYYTKGILTLDCPSYFARSPQTLSHAEILQYLLHAIEVVEALYGLSYLHTDLKAEHFIDDQGRVCLLDFEQMIHINEPYQGEMTATPRYMAPELFHGQAKTLQSEIYALGIIFLEWLTGQRLKASTYEDWAYLHCQQLQIHLPIAFHCYQNVLNAMLVKQKQHRIADFSRLKCMLLNEIE